MQPSLGDIIIDLGDFQVSENLLLVGEHEDENFESEAIIGKPPEILGLGKN